MSAYRHAIYVASAVLLLGAACATSPEADNRRLARAAEIDAILSLQPDPAEYGETKHCLADHEFRTFRPLDDRHILFEGRRGRLWISTLRTRCPDLRWGDVLVVRQFSSTRICDTDRFEVAHWFEWPWYRRWPWNWGRFGVGVHCTLGEFQPVTEQQLARLEEVMGR